MDTSAENIDVAKEYVSTFLQHHGVKGQKWGIRRSPKQLAKANGGITKYKDHPKLLTDAELATRIKRLETEKRYKELNKKTVGVGQKHINEVLITIGKNTATKVGTAAAVYGAKKAIDKKFGVGKAAEVFPKKG